MTPAQSTDQERIRTLLAPRYHIVLSPHYDDMALSIGATMATVAAAGRSVLDLIVFGTDPAGLPLHDFAQHHHDAWGVTATEAITSRQREEAAAVAIIGASTDNLPFHDAIYREDHYTSDEALFGTPSPAESDLPQAIADAAMALSVSLVGPLDTLDDGQVRFYAPLAVGHHVDHQLVFEAARIMSLKGYVVWLFEDLPYAMIGSNRDNRLTELHANDRSVTEVCAVPIDAQWPQKLAAVLAYPSQLETVFTNYAGIDATPNAIDRALTGYHTAPDRQQRVERFWTFARNDGRN